MRPREEVLPGWLASGLDDYVAPFVFLQGCDLQPEYASPSEREEFLASLQFVLEAGWFEEISLGAGPKPTGRSAAAVVDEIRAGWIVSEWGWRWGIWFRITPEGEREARLEP